MKTIHIFLAAIFLALASCAELGMVSIEKADGTVYHYDPADGVVIEKDGQLFQYNKETGVTIKLKETPEAIVVEPTK